MPSGQAGRLVSLLLDLTAMVFVSQCSIAKVDDSPRHILLLQYNTCTSCFALDCDTSKAKESYKRGEYTATVDNVRDDGQPQTPAAICCKRRLGFMHSSLDSPQCVCLARMQSRAVQRAFNLSLLSTSGEIVYYSRCYYPSVQKVSYYRPSFHFGYGEQTGQRQNQMYSRLYFASCRR